MKILKTYKTQKEKNTSKYGTNSPLIRQIRELYNIDEIVLGSDISPKEYAELICQYDVLLTDWADTPVPTQLIQNQGKLRYICNISGDVSKVADKKLIESPDITITDWGDTWDFYKSESAFALTCAIMKEIPVAIEHIQNGGTGASEQLRAASWFFSDVGIYGMTGAARKFIEVIRPFMAQIYAYDESVSDMPEGVTKAFSLKELFSKVEMLLIFAPLNEKTQFSVTEELLSYLTDGAILINVSDAKIFDCDSLLPYVETGRIRLGLDAELPYTWAKKDSPIHKCKHAILTGDVLSTPVWEQDNKTLDLPSTICLDNLKRFSRGEDLKFIINSHG